MKIINLENFEGEVELVYRLIVVDDEKFIRESIFAFAWQNIDVTAVGCFESGRAALEYLNDNPVDVVLTDICMPVMSGIELIEKIKEKDSRIAVICISGYSDYEYLRACMRAGANDYVLKPIDVDDLFETVACALAGKQTKKSGYDRKEYEELEEKDKKYHHDIEMAVDYIEKNYASYISLESVAEQVFLNPVYLSYLFKKVTGVKFTEYLNDYRMKKAVELLENSSLKIGEISTNIGYKDSRYFSEVFKKKMGMTPNEYRNKKK